METTMTLRELADNFDKIRALISNTSCSKV